MRNLINIRDSTIGFSNTNEIFIIKTENKPIHTTPAPSNPNDDHYVNAPKNSNPDLTR